MTNETVSLDSVTVERDSRGRLTSEYYYVEELDGEVKSRGLTKSEKRNHLGPMLDGEEIGSDVLAEWFEEKIDDPDLTEHPRAGEDGLTAEFVEEELTEDAEDGFFFAVLLASDLDELVNFYRKLYAGDMTVEDLEDMNIDPASLSEEEAVALGLDAEELDEAASSEDGEGN